MTATAGIIAESRGSSPVDRTAAVPLEGLFVQLPTDNPRSAAISHVAASLTCDAPALRAVFFNPAGQAPLLDPADQARLLDPAGQARLLTALLAVGHRYAQQEAVAVDVYLDLGSAASPASRVGVCVVHAAISEEAPSALTVAEVDRQLKVARMTLQTEDLVLAPRPMVSNIAITFSHRNPSLATGAPQNAPAYDLHVFVNVFVDDSLGPEARTPGGSLVFVYNAGLFERATVARMAGSFARLFQAILEDPTVPIHRLPMMSAGEVREVTVDWSSGHATYPPEPMHRSFEAWARARPNAIAADFQGVSLTYSELDRRANQMAHFLLANGAQRNTRVAVCVLPSFDVLVAMLAIFKAGAIYLPLDPTHPEALLRSILEEAQARLVVTQRKLADLFKPESFDPTLRLQRILLDHDTALSAPPAGPSATSPSPSPLPLPLPLEHFSSSAPALDITLADPCYQLYTSGTTGKPKGVVATHGNLAHYLHAAQQKYGFRADDVFCSLARYTFSISMFELLSPLCCGGRLRLLERDNVLAPERLALTLEDVTVVHAGPSLMGNLLRHLRTNPSAPRSFPRMRHASSGGDLVPPHLLEEMKGIFQNAELFVIYGCTECSCMGTTYPVLRGERVTRNMVGRPFPDVTVRLVDPGLNLVPLGVVGEICFSGKGVVPGYFERPALTAEKFIELEGTRFYRTGDLGRLHPDGNLEILGRRDFQVQLRGIRIELPGIENTVRELGLAWQCAVAVKKLDEHDTRLVAFVVKPRDETADIVSFRHALATHLPDYMLPQSLVVLDALPVTANGKLDRKRLQDLPWQPQPAPTRSRAAPRNSVERNIAAAFSSCLGIPEAQVGIDDDFFDLGGHSLLAVSLLDDLENKLGLTFPPDVLFSHANIRALSAYSQHSFAADPRPILLNANQVGPTLFVLLGVHLYRPLARRLEASYSVRAIYAGRELVMFDSPALAPSVDALARDYVQIIRRHQPAGPYRLVGMSFGGIVAYEVARQLRAANQEVTFLGLLDAVLPEHGLGRRVQQVQRLGGLPRRQLLELVSSRVQRLVKGALDGHQASSEHSGRPEPRKYQGEARLLPLEDQRQEAYRIATEDYVRRMTRMTRFDGDALLVVAARRMQGVLMQSPSLGWDVVIPGLRVRDVDSDHLGLLAEPGVRDVADIFLETLRQADDRPLRPLRTLRPLGTSRTSPGFVHPSSSAGSQS